MFRRFQDTKRTFRNLLTFRTSRILKASFSRAYLGWGQPYKPVFFSRLSIAAVQAVTWQSSGSRQAVVRKLSEGHWLVYRHSLDKLSFCNYLHSQKSVIIHFLKLNNCFYVSFKLQKWKKKQSENACLKLKQCREIGLASFLSGGFITAIIVKPPERKQAKCTSVQCIDALLGYVIWLSTATFWIMC